VKTFETDQVVIFDVDNEQFSEFIGMPVIITGIHKCLTINCLTAIEQNCPKIALSIYGPSKSNIYNGSLCGWTFRPPTDEELLLLKTIDHSKLERFPYE